MHDQVNTPAYHSFAGINRQLGNSHTQHDALLIPSLILKTSGGKREERAPTPSQKILVVSLDTHTFSKILNAVAEKGGRIKSNKGKIKKGWHEEVCVYISDNMHLCVLLCFTHHTLTCVGSISHIAQSTI